MDFGIEAVAKFGQGGITAIQSQASSPDRARGVAARAFLMDELRKYAPDECQELFVARNRRGGKLPKTQSMCINNHRFYSGFTGNTPVGCQLLGPKYTRSSSQMKRLRPIGRSHQLGLGATRNRPCRTTLLPSDS